MSDLEAPSEQAVVADAEQRRRALDAGGSFIVQAPAGSGKTELLVRRFLSLLAAVERPEAVLAVTFTRKAAAEMRERIVDALHAAAVRENGAAGEPADVYEAERLGLAAAVLVNSRARHWDLLENSGRLQVFTLDGLCARIVGATPLLSRFGSAPATVEDPVPYYREAARRILQRAGEDSSLGRSAARLLRRSAMRPTVVEERIVYMLQKRDQWAPDVLKIRDGPHAAVAVIKAFERTLGGLMDSHLDGLARSCGESTRAAIANLARLTAANLQEGEESDPCAWKDLAAGAELAGGRQCVAAWKQAASMLLTGKKELRKPGGFNVGQGAPPRSEAKRAFEALREDIESWHENRRETFLRDLAAMLDFPDSAEFEPATGEQLTALFEVLIAAHAQLWLVLQEAGAADFVEISVRALDALRSGEGSPSDLLLGIDTVIDHILVDEFQDTSRRQCELIRALTDGWTPGDGRSLFLVGDPMQSIYRFRKAEVGLFLYAATGEGGLFPNVALTPIVLSVNFRSAPAIIEWVNATFGKLLGERDDGDFGGVDYSACSPGPLTRPGGSPELMLWTDAGGDDPHRAEAEGLAERIETDLLPSARREGGETAKVAVLVRARKHAAALVDALRRRGVGFRAEKLEPLSERPHILDLQSLVRFILHREDRLSGLALLHSPLVGLTDADLCSLVEADVERATRSGDRELRTQPTSLSELLYEDEAMARLDADPRRRAEYCRAALLDARAQLGLRPLEMVIRSAWLRLGGPQLVDAAGAADAELFLALVCEISRCGSFDADELRRRLAELYASVDPSPEIALEIMTVHQAKGLEFDTVLLPALGRGVSKNSSLPMHIETDPASGEISCCAPAKESGHGADDDAKFAFLSKRDARRDQAETLRVLYVACTRAKRRLILSADDKLPGKGCPPSGSSLAFLWPAVAAAFTAENAGCTASAEAAVPVRPRRRIRLDWLADPGRDRPASLELRSVCSERPSQHAEAGEDAVWTTSRRYLAVGSVVHAFLQRIAEDGVDTWDAERIAEPVVQSRILRALAREGLAAEEIESARGDIAAALHNVLEDQRGRWILSGEHEDAHCEWRVASYHRGDQGDVYTRAGVDRTFVDGGVRWVVDYKTDRAAAGQEAAAFMKERFEHYRPQLESYAGMLAQLDAEVAIRIALYFPLLESEVGRFCDEAFEPRIARFA